MTAAAENATRKCPKCGAEGSGKFCSECGATLGHSICASCGSELIDGAKFCHRCGLPAGAAAPPSEQKPSSALSLPWIVAAIALLAFIALVAGQRFGANRPAAAPEGQVAAELPQQRAPDISNMTPAEQAIRLHDRIMQWKAAGKQDSVDLFAPMGMAAFERLGNLDDDSRYDLGMLGWASNDATVARAQADTILQKNPKHLLGLILAARAAKMENREADERRYDQRLLAAEPAERATGRDEYIIHEGDINLALEEARRITRR
jgi:hypothetical protein